MAEQSSRLAVIIDSSGAQNNADSLATSSQNLPRLVRKPKQLLKTYLGRQKITTLG